MGLVARKGRLARTWAGVEGGWQRGHSRLFGGGGRCRGIFESAVGEIRERRKGGGIALPMLASGHASCWLVGH
jgi:hypothetical protein